MENALIFLCYWLVWSDFCPNLLNSLESEIFITSLLLCSSLKYLTNGELHSAVIEAVVCDCLRPECSSACSSPNNHWELILVTSFVILYWLLVTWHEGQLNGAAACEAVSSLTCQWNCKAVVQRKLDDQNLDCHSESSSPLVKKLMMLKEETWLIAQHTNRKWTF